MSDDRYNLQLDLKTFLRACVTAQDLGEPVAEIIERAYGNSCMHSLMVAAHIERLRMHDEGFAVQMPPKDSTRGFILGFPSEDDDVVEADDLQPPSGPQEKQ